MQGRNGVPAPTNPQQLKTHCLGQRLHGLGKTCKAKTATSIIMTTTIDNINDGSDDDSDDAGGGGDELHDGSDDAGDELRWS